MVKSFPNYFKRVKWNFLNITDFIEEYKLDDSKPLIPQIENSLGRSMTKVEKDNLETAYQQVVVNQYHENDEEERNNFRNNFTESIYRKMKKK